MTAVSQDPSQGFLEHNGPVNRSLVKIAGLGRPSFFHGLPYAQTSSERQSSTWRTVYLGLDFRSGEAFSTMEEGMTESTRPRESPAWTAKPRRTMSTQGSKKISA